MRDEEGQNLFDFFESFFLFCGILIEYLPMARSSLFNVF